MTLLDNGQVEPTAHFHDCLNTFADIKLALTELIVNEHSYRTVVIDTINGVERLAQEEVVGKEFGGSWEKFSDWGKTGIRTLTPIVELTTLLDRCREKGMGVILLAHSKVKTAKNPEGLDYERWEPVLVSEVQGHLERWCDAILFGKFEVHVQGRDGKATKGKARDGQTRLIMTENHATYSAGNRMGLPEEIECGGSCEEAWGNLVAALKG